jgi:UDP-N-acetylmuramoyl-tripeptide--D-alanyl-D-alanine ligase
VLDALAGGATAALVARPVGGAAVIRVPDVLVALQRLAAHVRRAIPGTVIGVTGSSGKTTAKDLLHDVLSAEPVVATQASFNNELGLPLTMLRADEGTRFVVVEMGARGVGHIADLCRIAAPSVGVVLNVGTAHVGEFGSAEAVAVAKGELVESLPPDGVAVLNADDPRVARMRERTTAEVVTFGVDDTADVRAEHVRLVQGAAHFTLAASGERVGVALNLLGEHQVSNALAAAAVGLRLGLPAEDVATRLSMATPSSKWRMELATSDDGVLVINDAYNANPESMRAALKTLVQVAGPRRSWAVLGEMRELGAGAAQEHDAIGRLAVRLDVSRLVAVGPGARAIHLGASHEGSWGEESAYVENIDDAVVLLREQLRPGDVVLVKASRAGGFERIAEALLTAEAVA